MWAAVFLRAWDAGAESGEAAAHAARARARTAWRRQPGLAGTASRGTMAWMIRYKRARDTSAWTRRHPSPALLARLEPFHSLPPKALTGAGVCAAMLIKDSKPSAAKGRAPPALAPPARSSTGTTVSSLDVSDISKERRARSSYARPVAHQTPDLHLA